MYSVDSEYSVNINYSTSVMDAQDAFTQTLRGWINRCIARYSDAPATNVHDQGTYTTGWESYVQATDDCLLLTFLKAQRDRIRQHFVASGQWHHGYWRMQEAHHGTEHYELFLGMLWRLDPDDEITVEQLIDVAEHMGNWSTAVEPWFDWDSGLYRSFLFGSDGIRLDEGATLNVPDHFRCINIALLANRATGDKRYIDLAATHGGRWADAILAEAEFPIGLLPDRAIYRFSAEEETLYRTRVGQSSALLSPIDRAESFLTSDAINTLLCLWQETGEQTYRLAAERLLDTLVPTLHDADAGAVADAIRHYRRWTTDRRYDSALCDAIAHWPSSSVQHLSFDPIVQSVARPSGVGKRSDMLCWLEDGATRRTNPITLGVVAEITDDKVLAQEALDLAAAYLQLACMSLPDGREHGCAARTVSAVARGHGRENHAGMVTAVYGPLRRMR